MGQNKVKKKTYELILDLFMWLSLFLAVLLVVATIFATYSDKQNGKEIFGVKMFIVKSDSMSISSKSVNEKIHFNAGDVVLIKQVNDVYSFKAGDVISFISLNKDSYGQTVTHKIREVKYSTAGELIGYVTYGIHTGVNDQTLVQPENVVGVYVGKIPTIGYIFSFLKTPSGYFMSILIPCMLLIIFFSIKVGRVIGKKEAKQEFNSEFVIFNDRIIALEKLAFTIADEREAVREITEEIIEEDKTENLEIKAKTRYSFSEKLLALDTVKKEFFNTIHNQLTSYRKVNGRISKKCLSYRLGRKLLAKITVRGKTLKLHLSLSVDEFNNNVYFQKDLSSVKTYEDVPFTVKVKSNRGVNNAIRLINALMDKEGVQLKRNFEYVNAIKQLSDFEKNN